MPNAEIEFGNIENAETIFFARFQKLRPRSGVRSRSQDRHCEPLVPRPMAVDNDEMTLAFYHHFHPPGYEG